MNSLKIEEEKSISTTELITIDVKEKDFELLMSIYKKALDKVLNELNQVKERFNELYGYNIINNITFRIKTPSSIVKKMKKKHYKLNYKNLISNINDVAGIRIVCPLKSDVYTIIQLLEYISDIKILKTKDYLTKPKKSGYSGYHLIIETPVELEDRKIPVKVEIQLRTMAMDFWATNEHKMRYKTNNQLSFWDSKKLTFYAKILNILDNKIMKLGKKQESIIN